MPFPTRYPTNDSSANNIQLRPPNTNQQYSSQGALPTGQDITVTYPDEGRYPTQTQNFSSQQAQPFGGLAAQYPAASLIPQGGQNPLQAVIAAMMGGGQQQRQQDPMAQLMQYLQMGALRGGL